MGTQNTKHKTETQNTKFENHRNTSGMMYFMSSFQVNKGLTSLLQTVLVLGLICFLNVQAASPTSDRLYDEIMETHRSHRRRLPAREKAEKEFRKGPKTKENADKMH